MSLNKQIFKAAGQPLTARIGVVVDTTPLVVDVQGTRFTELGLVGTAPAIGDNVLLLGQSVLGSSSSGSSWVCLGTIVAG